jgi:hypothetical protein
MNLTPEPGLGGERRGLLPRFTLKDADTFLLADALGDVQASDDGLFTGDTRLFCGFDRRTGEGPTPYPVACLRRPGHPVLFSCCYRRVLAYVSMADVARCMPETPRCPLASSR